MNVTPTESSTASARCKSCGATLEEGATEGLCACCVLSTALSILQSGDDSPEELESPGSLLENREFSNYELLSELGRGGMGVVFKAHQKKPDRLVALKVIAAGELASSRMIARFHMEAKAAAALNHPNIVPIFEVGEHRGWHYFSMQWIDGPTLADVIALLHKTASRSSESSSAPPAVSSVASHLASQWNSAGALVSVVVALARAVHFAHQHGILHRDLKPTNILLDSKGKPHLTDFGLAKMLADESSLTLSKAVLGTPAYMAPEQAAGQMDQLTVATDVYGLGALLYEMLTGQPPFLAKNTPSLLRKIAEEEPMPPAQRILKSAAKGGPAFRIDRDLEVICLKCLEKAPGRRYPSAEELATDLERWLRGEPIQARSSTAWERGVKWVRRHPAPAGLLATLVLAGFVITTGSVWFSFRLHRARLVAEQHAQQSLSRLVRQHAHEAAVLAEHGDALASLHPLVEALRLTKDDPEASARLRHRLGLVSTFSPHTVRIWNAGGQPMRLQFSIDGKRLMTTLRSAPPQAWDLDSGKRLTSPGADPSGFSVVEASFSADGHLVLELSDQAPYARIHNLDTGATHVLDLAEPCQRAGAISPDGQWMATGGRKILVRPVGLKDAPATAFEYGAPCIWLSFSPDSKRLLAAYADQVAILWEVSDGRRIGDPISCQDGVTWSKPSFGPDGRRILIANARNEQIIDAERFIVEGGLPHPGVLLAAAASSDGSAVATASFRGQARLWDLKELKLLPPTLEHESGGSAVAFSPDGQVLATGGFDYQVRLCRRSDLREIAPTLHHTALITSLAFSPDGRLLATAAASGAVQVWDVGLQQGRSILQLGPAQRLTDGTPNAILSADHLALASVETDQSWRLFRVASNSVSAGPPIPGSKRAVIAWNYRHDQIAVADEGGSIVLRNAADGAQSGTLTAGKAVRSLAFSPDGRRLAAGLVNGGARILSLDSGKETVPPMLLSNAVSVLGWSPDSRWLATGSGGTVRLWNAATGQPFGSPQIRAGEVQKLSFNKEGTRFVAAFADSDMEPRVALLMSVTDPKQPVIELPLGDGVRDALFSPDGKLIVTAGEDNTVRLWHSDSGLPASPAMRHGGMVMCADFSPDGQFLVTGGNDHTLRFWEVETGELMGPPLRFSAGIGTVAFTPDGSRVVTVVSDHSNWLVDFPSNQRPVTMLAHEAVLATGHRLGTAGGLIPTQAADLEREFASDEIRKPLNDVASLTAWHERQALVAEHGTNWFAAAFHWKELTKLHPLDGDVANDHLRKVSERVPPPAMIKER